MQGQDVSFYRAVVARCNYLGFDRPDAQLAIKDSCREVSRPTTRSMELLYRIGRYLKARPRLVWHSPFQAATTIVDVVTDANWLGCKRTRKSTSGGAVMVGARCLKTYSKTQSVVAGSSGESELYGIVKGTCEGLSILTLLADFGCVMQARVHTDTGGQKRQVEGARLLSPSD